MTAGYSVSEQMQSAGCGAANGSIDAVSCVGSSPQPLIQSSSTTQQLARQPQILKKLHHPVAGATCREDNVASCCQHCTSCQMKMSSVAGVPDDCGRRQSWPHNVPRTAENMHSSAAAYRPTTAAVARGSVQNSVSSAGSSGDSLRIQNTSALVAVSCASSVMTPCQACCLPAEHPAMSGQNVYSSMEHSGCWNVVEAVPSPSLTASPHCLPLHNTQSVTGGPKQNGQFCQQPLPHGPRFLQASHRHEGQTCEKTRCSRDGYLTARHPVTPIRLPSPASEQSNHNSVARQPRHMSDAHRLPLNVTCASGTTADHSGCHQCPSSVSPSVAAKVMQCTESQQFSTSALVANAGSKAILSSNQPGAPLWASKSNADVCEQGIVYNSDLYASQGKPALINNSEQTECEVDLQRVSSHISTHVANVPVSSGPRTVNELLSSIAVQNIDWSIALAQDRVTVDGFIESVLGHHSASVDSGLQVNDSAVSAETSPKTLPALTADNCNNVLYDVGDCVTKRHDGSSQQPVNIKKCRNVHVEPAEYQDRPKVAEKFTAHDDRPKLCSVAVNTSLYWPPADSEHAENWHRAVSQNDARCLISAVTGCNDTTLSPASNTGVESNSPTVVTASQRLYVSNEDIALVSGSSAGACDSMADVSLCTPPPPPPVFPHPSEESVVSEMIMDMPEYTALSHEK